MPVELSAREILAKLVGFPTVSDQSNLPLIDWVEGYLSDWGAECHRVYNPKGDKANLYAVIGPLVEGGVALSGHTDVVPVTGQAWSSDPFVLTERDGKLYGRGAVDMKAFVALAISTVPKAAKTHLKRPLYLALSYDEEVGCDGCVSMVEAMADSLPRPEAVIVGEPSRMQVVNGQKGSMSFKVHVRGHEVHSSMLPQGVSAVMEAGRLIDWANRMNVENQSRRPAPLAAPFDPPWTTVHVGTISGGTANNITAKDCELTFDFRIVPSESPEDWERRLRSEADAISKKMQDIAPEVGITMERVFYVPPLAPESEGSAEPLAKRLAGRNSTAVVSYGTEAGHFQKNGWSTVVFGPGDIAEAHKPDEYITCTEYAAGLAWVDTVVAWLSR